MGRLSQKFDRELFSLKLLELSNKMQIRKPSHLQKGGCEHRKVSRICFDPNRRWSIHFLRSSLETVDRICREVWQSQGEAITPEFVREILVPEAMTLIGTREGKIKSLVTPPAPRTRLEDPHPAQHHLAMEVERLKAEIANRYEIEVGKLGYRNARTEGPLGQESKLATVQQAQEHPIAPAKEIAGASSAGRRQAQLTDREKKLWDVIRRGARGLQYCRELDKARIAPLRRGAWKDCPRKYESAYLQGEPWRHRIQDEKSKVRRKAEGAGLGEDSLASKSVPSAKPA